MKRIFFLISITLLSSIIISSCSSTPTYAELLNSEKVVIAAYIKDQKINVIKKLPTNNIWGANDYYLSDTGLYFHLISPGVGTDSVELGNTVVPRYKQYTLTAVSDTISNWSTIDSPYPVSFTYGLTTASSCVAFQEAATYMKHNESEAKIIVPSKLGFNADMLSVTPYGYDIKIQFRK